MKTGHVVCAVYFPLHGMILRGLRFLKQIQPDLYQIVDQKGAILLWEFQPCPFGHEVEQIHLGSPKYQCHERVRGGRSTQTHR